MVEQELERAAENVKRAIKAGMAKKGIKQTEMADLIHEGTFQVSRAINGDMQPKSKKIRKKIYLILGMES